MRNKTQLTPTPSQCFSTLERLRLAQGSSLTRTNSASSNALTRKSQATSVSSPPTLAPRNSSYFKHQHCLRPRKNPSSPISDTFSCIDAQWFQRLPDKVQRRHFTEEERTFLSGYHHRTVVPDAADLRLYELSKYLETNRSVPTLNTSSTPSPRSSISTFEAVGGMDDSMMDTFHCFDNDDDLDLASTLDDYHRFHAQETKKQNSSHHPSFRRVISLSSIPFVTTMQHPPLPTKSSYTATATPQQAKTPLTPTFPNHSRNFSHTPGPTHKLNPSTTTLTRNLEPNATHYQDPSTRLKLRVYLSPQKFDEAIEFGFPSMEDNNRPSSRPSLQNQRQYHTHPPGRTFLDDSNPSIFDALSASDSSDDETQSLPERDGSPYTPQDPHFNDTYLLSPSIGSNNSRSSLHKATFAFPPRTIFRHGHSEPLAKALAGNREMTLRMTMTRPDIRADKKALYEKTTGDDPLALEHLPEIGEKRGDIWDTLPPVKENGLKKIWRKVVGKVS
ncbi:MAG: hypothetical protein Q9217_003862 [Psora testacea]